MRLIFVLLLFNFTILEIFGSRCPHAGGDSIIAGMTSTCLLKGDGTGKCWGSNTNGVVADGTRTNRLTPTSIIYPTGVTSFDDFSLSSANICAKVGKDRYCMGKNDYYNLGVTGDTTDLSLTSSTAAVWVKSTKTEYAGKLEVLGDHKNSGNAQFIITDDYKLYGVGNKMGNALGDGSNTNSNVEVR